MQSILFYTLYLPNEKWCCPSTFKVYLVLNTGISHLTIVKLPWTGAGHFTGFLVFDTIPGQTANIVLMTSKRSLKNGNWLNGLILRLKGTTLILDLDIRSLSEPGLYRVINSIVKWIFTSCILSCVLNCDDVLCICFFIPVQIYEIQYIHY